MKKFILILGGARSGKSSYAVELAKKISKKVAFIATAAASDEEMVKRINLHRISRPRHWKLIEEAKNINSFFPKLKKNYEVVLIDCIGLWISNLLLEDFKDRIILNKVIELLNTISATDITTIIVSNEVGSGLVPENPLARRFRDLLGSANQMMAKKADEVTVMQAGIPLKIKIQENHLPR